MNAPAGQASIEPVILAFCLAMTRISAFVVASPMLGRGTVPNSVKVGLCVSLAAFWLPAYMSRVTPGLDPAMPAFVFALVNEFVVGMALGFLVRLVMLPTRIAGRYVGQELGFNLGQVTDPSSGMPNNEGGLLFDALGLVIFWVTDIHHVALRMLGLSLFAIDNGIELALQLAPIAADFMGYAHELGLLIVAPLATILLLILVYLMVLMRAWQHITLFSFGMGIRLMMGLGALLCLLPLIVSSIELVLLTLSQTIHDLVLPS